MSRMHKSRRGSSGSKRPMLEKNPDWVQQSPAEVMDLVAKLAGENMSMAKVGLVLRDQYAIPDVRLATGKSMKQIFAAKGLTTELPEDLASLMKKAVELNNHLKNNRRDLHNRHGLQLMESKIRRLVKYYKAEGLLPSNWKYSLATAALQVE